MTHHITYLAATPDHRPIRLVLDPTVRRIKRRRPRPGADGSVTWLSDRPQRVAAEAPERERVPA
jgi:hypothetical protein